MRTESLEHQRIGAVLGGVLPESSARFLSLQCGLIQAEAGNSGRSECVDRSACSVGSEGRGEQAQPGLRQAGSTGDTSLREAEATPPGQRAAEAPLKSLGAGAANEEMSRP